MALSIQNSASCTHLPNRHIPSAVVPTFERSVSTLPNHNREYLPVFDNSVRLDLFPTLAHMLIHRYWAHSIIWLAQLYLLDREERLTLWRLLKNICYRMVFHDHNYHDCGLRWYLWCNYYREDLYHFLAVCRYSLFHTDSVADQVFDKGVNDGQCY